jgi:hypothetical protein
MLDRPAAAGQRAAQMSVDELVEKPSRPDDLCVGSSDPLPEFTVGGNHDHITIRRCHCGDGFVAVIGCMYHRHAADVVNGPSDPTSTCHSVNSSLPRSPSVPGIRPASLYR